MQLHEVFLRVQNMLGVANYIIVFVMLVRLFLWKAPKKYSYILWGVVLFRLLCPIAPAAPISLLNMVEVSLL